MVSNSLTGFVLYDSQNEKMVGSEDNEFVEKTRELQWITPEVLHSHIQLNFFG